MKKFFLSLILQLVMLPALIQAQSYTQLWKQVEEAEGKDLPKTKISLLEKIIKKATSERCYGHLLKACLSKADAQVSITPDSLPSEIQRLKAEAEKLESENPVLCAVYQSIIGHIYLHAFSLGDDHETVGRHWYERSMSHPALLAATLSKGYEPMVTVGADSRLFNNDLLHVIGMEAKAYHQLHDYYESVGMRAAACLAALYQEQDDKELSNDERITLIDSLIHVYEDLPVCGELAIERISLMDRAESYSAVRSYSAKDKIDFIEHSISKWNNWPRLFLLHNKKQLLTQPSFRLQMGNSISMPGDERMVVFEELRNISQLTLTVTRVKVDGRNKLRPYNTKDYQQLKTLKVHDGSEQSHTLTFGHHEAYEFFQDSVLLRGMPKGVYLVEASAKTTNTEGKEGRLETTAGLLYVSDLFVISEELPENKVRLAVVSAKSGRPVSGATIRLTTRYGQKEDDVTILTTNHQGEALYSYTSRKASDIYVSTADDTGLPENMLISGFSFYQRDGQSQVVRIYTDRSIYRPGQTVHAAIIVFNKVGHEDAQPATGKEYTLVLRDANNKTVKELHVTTDLYGKASADFTLPTIGLTGLFSISCPDRGSKNCSFRVEEYKRPTFQITFDEVSEAYEQGDTVVVRGIAQNFAGIPVQGGRVELKATRQPAFWHWRQAVDYNSQLVALTTTVTDDQGAFTLKVPMLLPKDALSSGKGQHQYYRFLVEADVTDQGGESHHGETSLPLSSHPTAFYLDMPEKILADSICMLTFRYQNNAGNDIAGKVCYILNASNNSKALKDAMGMQTVETNKPFSLPVKSLRSGEYMLTAICGSDTLSQKFIVFRLNDKKPVTETHDWFYVSAKEFPRDGCPVYVQMGSTDDHQHIVYTLVSGTTVLESGVIDQDHAITLRAYKYKEVYGDGVTFTCAWVREGRLYTHTACINKPLPEKKLNLKWTTFRDRLTPGQQEQWTLHISNPNGSPAHAQLLATLYDASLDELAPHQLDFSLSLFRQLPHLSWNGTYADDLQLYGSRKLQLHEINDLSFSSLDTSILQFAYYGTTFRNGRFVRVRGTKKFDTLTAAPVMMAKASNSQAMDALAEVELAMNDEEQTDTKDSTKKNTSLQVRENLTETAFFYPALMTDAQGNVCLRFTLPESITTWQFRALAHDQQMNFGQLEAQAVAQKEVMIQPNIPRFLRHGDDAVVTAKVINNTTVQQTGMAHLQLVNPSTGEVVSTEQCTFMVEGSQTTRVTFPLTTPAEGLYVCIVTVEGTSYSDGEQHYLPILPNRELVTTTLPFTQHEPGTYVIDLSAHVKENADGYRKAHLTIEYTNNPAWLMIQTLPYLSSTNEKDAISLASAFYSNTLAADILHSSPNIKKTIELWRQEQASQGGGSFKKSPLERNEELKQMVLAETPWIADASQDEEQQQMLVNFFDENSLNQRLTTLSSQLAILQNSDGAFSWWPGMQGSRMVTTLVAHTLARLQKPSSMLTRAVEFLAAKAHEEVVELKKAEKKHRNLQPSELAIDYLYICAITQTTPNKADNDYLIKLLARQNKDLSIYGKANAAVIFAYNGHPKQADEFLKSLWEYSVYTEEMGRYFDTPKALYSWRDYRIPTEVAAIEALRLLKPSDQQAVEEMQRWLLLSKRTQLWDTPVNTVNAVQAFLSPLASQLSPLTTVSTLKINGETLTLPRTTAGLGYVKTSIETDSLQTFSVEKTSKVTSWGAVYLQQLQSNDIIDASNSGITVEREVVEDPHTELTVGSKVKVRITITTDRDYDFVQVIDKRAACLEPVSPLSGYRHGCYITPRDHDTRYFFDQMSKGRHIIETEYYIDRTGTYQTGTCSVQCAYAPEYSGRAKPIKLSILR